MKIYENGSNWIIEDYIEESLVNEIANIIEKNLGNLFCDKEGYSTTGKNANQYWFTNARHNIDYKGKEFLDFKKKYKEQIFNRLKKSNLLSEKLNLKLNDNSSWTVIGQENSYHTVHCHCEGRTDGISTVLYLKTPNSKVSLSDNKIFLVMNSCPENPFYENKPGIVNIDPEVGKVIIFPNWIYHGTYPQSKGIRQTFNIDYFFEIESSMGNKNIINYA